MVEVGLGVVMWLQGEPVKVICYNWKVSFFKWKGPFGLITPMVYLWMFDRMGRGNGRKGFLAK